MLKITGRARAIAIEEKDFMRLMALPMSVEATAEAWDCLMHGFTADEVHRVFEELGSKGGMPCTAEQARAVDDSEFAAGLEHSCQASATTGSSCSTPICCFY